MKGPRSRPFVDNNVASGEGKGHVSRNTLPSRVALWLDPRTTPALNTSVWCCGLNKCNVW